MSLLMDALKKAEASKRQAGESDTAASISLTPLPESSSEAQRSPLPEIAQHSDAIDADLASEPTLERVPRRVVKPAGAATSTAGRREAAERQAASQVFSAKQSPRSPRSGWMLILGLSAVVALGIGGYFWWQLQPAAPRLQTPVLARPAAPVTQNPVTPPAPPAPMPVQAVATVAEKAAVSSEAAPLASAPLREAPVHEAPPVKAQKPASHADAAAPLRLNKTRPATLPLLEKAWTALQAGHPDEAGRGYAQVLRSDPRNVDALLGLASIALHREQSGQAEEYYLRVLEIDPDDATAQAGLIGLKGQSDPGLNESRLKTALSRQPESAPLHFALGNLYARQQRWSEAQQAYFKAFSCDADNPDYLFNLAVSLDHLRQPRLAAQYYQQALDAAGGARSISFDRQQAIKRLSELQ